MDGATLQGKIYKGYAMAAGKIGIAHTQYRPLSATAPLANQIGSVLSHFRVDDKFAKPNVYGKALWLAYLDGRLTKVGDYLIGPSGTFFIAAQQALLPILVVNCNHTITLSRVAPPTGVGGLGYDADTPAAETAYMTGWPASILKGAKGEANEVGLPGDVRQPWWDCLLPAFPGVLVEPADIVFDEQGNRYITSVCELTDLGWRLTLQEAVT